MGRIIPIDIVLLVDKKTEEICKTLNQNLDKINFEYSRPHISLGMFIVDEDNLKNIFEGIKDLFNYVSRFSLEIDSIRNGEILSSLNLKKSIILSNLQRRIFDLFEKCNVYDYNLAARDFVLNESGDFDEITINWVKDYKIHSFGNNFNPHISLGYGNIQDTSFNHEHILVKKVAICHLGNLCTCREILFQKELH